MSGLVERLVAYANCEAPPIDDVLREAAERIAALEGEVERLRGRRRDCSCMEVYGEDPDCIKHGTGTPWRKANPDICELLDRAQSAEARLAEAEGVIERIKTEAGFGLRSHPGQASLVLIDEAARAFLKSNGEQK